MIFDNSRYLMILLKRVYIFLIGLILFFASLTLFFASKWYSATKKVYIIDSNLTFVARQQNMTPDMRKSEVEAFTKALLEKAFAHDQYSIESNLEEAMGWMDINSARIIDSLFPEEEKRRYYDQNAISKVSIEKVEVEEDGLDWEVAVNFKKQLHYLNLEEGAYKTEIKSGGLYLKLQNISRNGQNPWGLKVKMLAELKTNS
jgi:hypothetical protein